MQFLKKFPRSEKKKFLRMSSLQSQQAFQVNPQVQRALKQRQELEQIVHNIKLSDDQQEWIRSLADHIIRDEQWQSTHILIHTVQPMNDSLFAKILCFFQHTNPIGFPPVSLSIDMKLDC